MRPARPGFVVDANVLIDYSKSDLSVLGTLARVMAPVYVPDAVLAKVAQVDVADCDQLGLRVFQPDLEHLLEAGEKTGKLADDDWLCLILARDNGWTCITNDKALRTECVAAGIEVLWGLEPMVALVESGELGIEEAASIAWDIHESNPAFVTAKIVATFRKKLGRIKQERPHTRS